MKWQRARQPEQKAERLGAILQAAESLFDTGEFATVSMAGVAERAGIGKASVYHYFKTKEEVFLTLYLAEANAWLSDLESRLGRLRQSTPPRIADVLTEILRDRPRFARLTVIFSSVLERNVSGEFILRFKTALLAPMHRFVETLRRACPDLTERAAKEFLVQHHAVIAGLWPLAHPSAEVGKVIEAEEFRDFRIEFHPMVKIALARLLEGAITGSR